MDYWKRLEEIRTAGGWSGDAFNAARVVDDLEIDFSSIDRVLGIGLDDDDAKLKTRRR